MEGRGDLPAILFYVGSLLMWGNFKFEDVLFIKPYINTKGHFLFKGMYRGYIQCDKNIT
jgi:hypothetical protein